MNTHDSPANFHFRIDELPAHNKLPDSVPTDSLIGEILVSLLHIVDFTFKGETVSVDGFSFKNAPSKIISLRCSKTMDEKN